MSYIDSIFDNPPTDKKIYKLTILLVPHQILLKSMEIIETSYRTLARLNLCNVLGVFRDTNMSSLDTPKTIYVVAITHVRV